MLAWCDRAAQAGIPLYLYGGTKAMLETLQQNLVQRFPGLIIAGTHAPPFRPLTLEEEAVDRDRILWLNDDTVPSRGCIPAIVTECTQHPNKIVSAQCYASSAFDVPTYGGQAKEFLSIKLFHTPPGQTIACDCMSGNLVCLPRSVVEKIGYPPSKQLPHCLADIVYTWEAKKAGYELEVLGDATAVCAFNPMDEGWATSPIPMAKQWKLIPSFKSTLYPPAYWNSCKSFMETWL
jgi:hypothetical protein